MDSVSSFISGIVSNPFGTPVGQLIEKATDSHQASENWGLYMEICDLINSTEDGPKDAIRAIRKQLSNHPGKNFTTVLYTLTVLETCVKNCGKSFHVYVAHKEFLQELIKLITTKVDPPQIVQEKVLGLIQSWADAFQGSPELKEVERTYQELKNKGMEFPMTDLDRVVPIYTPPRSALAGPAKSSCTEPRPATTQSPTKSPPSRQCRQVTGPVLLNPEQLSKLRRELDIVTQNSKVLGELLTELVPGKENPDDLQLLKELSATCRQMQHRLLALIESIQNEDVTAELLHINDELNNIFVRYDRFERLRGTVAPAQHPPPAAASQKEECLIDFGDANPSRETPHYYEAVNMPKPDGAVPVTNKPAADDDSEFDMFAQSRQSYEQSQKDIHGNIYVNEPQQMSAGLGSAMAMKSKPNQRNNDDEMDEMSKWLSENEMTEQTATSSEFDQFLAARANDNGLEATTTTTTSSSSSPAKSSNKPDELFSL